MSLQTFVFENDEWVERTISADELMRDNSSSARKTGRPPLSSPPTCGVLTRTIVDSPVIRWVLPVQLRSARYNDVALIGDHSIQICELGRDRQLHNVIKKNDFGSRIRNAVVMGSPQYSRKASESTEDGTRVKDEDGDTDTIDLGTTVPGFRDVNSQLPPQLLILVLEQGDLVFLFLQQGHARSWVWVSSTHTVPGHRLVCPGFHMAIDPSSNFLTLGCSENLFIMYQLESMEGLKEQYFLKRPLTPIKDQIARSVKGIIHKIEFLHPTHGNEAQVILMVIIVQPEVSKLAVYEWDSRLEMRDFFRKEVPGYRLDTDYRLPLMVVPLKVRNAFLIITERITATCSDILAGPPVFMEFELANREDTDLHHGTREPLWTAWTRPIRHPPYHDRKDVIYLAREDGFINFLECGDESEIETSVSMGSVDCNIDTAFASLFHLFGDVLVTGGDSGPGAVWNVEARQSPQRIGSIPNWSPTVDLALTNDLANGPFEEHYANFGDMSVFPLRPDKVFTCSGRGITGTITELRHGIQARIGLEIMYSSIIRQCWAISDFDGTVEDGFFLLLALPNGSAVLHLHGDLSEPSEREHDTIPYDLTSTTLAAQEANDTIVQVTTNYITVVTPDSYSQNLTSEVVKDHTVTVAHAAIREHKIALAVYSGLQFKVVLLSIDGLEVSVQHIFDVDGEVTCLTIETYAFNTVVIAGLRQGGESTLAIYPGESEQPISAAPIFIQLQPYARITGSDIAEIADNDDFGALTSIVLVATDPGIGIIMAGTRSGEVLTIKNHTSQSGKYEVWRDRFGMSPSHVYPGRVARKPNSVLVCCDTELAILTGAGEEMHRILPTDGDTPSMSCPPINSITPLYEQIPEHGETTLAIISGSRILITELQRERKPVPRYFPLGGTPVKIIYSSKLEALVTVVSRDGLPSLHFIDPTTGHDLSQPLERKKVGGESYNYSGVDYITGLGNPETRAIALTTWTYRHGGVVADWIVLAMRKRDKEGLLLIISAGLEKVPTESGVARRIRFWTKFDRKIRDGPLWSVATDESGVFLCIGTHVQYHVIEQGRFTVVRQHEIPSPASWMQVVNGRLHVFTTRHSLIVLDYKNDLVPEGEQMVRLHTDDTCRNSLHSIEVGGAKNAITMLSDPMCGVHGLWAPSEDERPLKLVFQAELQASVRRFARGYTRVSNGSFKNRPRFGSIQSGPVGSDILGLTIDGSLQHFSLLNEDAWRFLRFIQNLALMSAKVCPHSPMLNVVASDWNDHLDPEPKSEPKLKMHVDGDILQRCLDRRVLEELMADPQHMKRFRELLDPLDDDGLLQDSRETESPDFAHITLAYQILEYYLAPVL